MRQIRIEPDWNVKKDTLIQDMPEDFIRIEPDWNVKVFFFRKPFTVIQLE